MSNEQDLWQEKYLEGVQGDHALPRVPSTSGALSLSSSFLSRLAWQVATEGASCDVEYDILPLQK